MSEGTLQKAFWASVMTSSFKYLPTRLLFPLTLDYPPPKKIQLKF
jgi:hypothetical protein